MHTNLSCRQTDMFSLSKNRSSGRSVFWSPSLSPLWQVESFIREMLQTRPTCQIEDKLFMDWSLGMVIHSQKIIQRLQSYSFTHIAANSQMTMVLSCSWMGEYNNETLLHLNWGSSNIKCRWFSLLSIEKGGKCQWNWQVVARLKVSTTSVSGWSSPANTPVSIHKIVLVDTRCCFQAKDSWILLWLGTWWSCQETFRDELDL